MGRAHAKLAVTAYPARSVNHPEGNGHSVRSKDGMERRQLSTAQRAGLRCQPALLPARPQTLCVSSLKCQHPQEGARPGSVLTRSTASFSTCIGRIAELKPNSLTDQTNTHSLLPTRAPEKAKSSPTPSPYTGVPLPNFHTWPLCLPWDAPAPYMLEAATQALT